MAKILVIDDASEIRRLIRTALERASHEVAEASNASEGFDRFTSTRPDLVVTDVFMPERDGIEFLRFVGARDGAVPIS
jgi:CheY-like chemotaxis protein